MKIAVFYELHGGGALRTAQALALELAKDHQVDIFQTTDFHSDPHPHGLLARIKHDTWDLFILAIMHWKLARTIDKAQYDFALIYSGRWTQAPFLLSFLKTPKVYYCHEPLRLVYDPWFADLTYLPLINRIYEGLNRKIRKLIDSANIRKANLILVNSKFTQNWVKRAYGLTASVVYLAADYRLFSPKREKKRFDVLFFGTPEPIEGYDLLLAAQKQSQRKWKIKTLKRGNSGEGVSDRQLVKIINQSRVVVCLAHSEPFGLTVLEAMACGVPVLAVNEGGYRESIKQGKTGFLIKRDAITLARIINRLLEHPTLAKKIGKQGRNQILLFWTWKKSGLRLLVRIFSFLPKRDG